MLGQGQDLQLALKHHCQENPDGWPLQIHRGLHSLLGSRTGPVQQHSTLQLAAAMTDLFGPGWLIEPNAPSMESSDGASFFQLLVEVVTRETMLLLQDAKSPNQVVSPENVQVSPATVRTESVSPVL